jgi:hypothetical protein
MEGELKTLECLEPMISLPLKEYNKMVRLLQNLEKLKDLHENSPTIINRIREFPRNRVLEEFQVLNESEFMSIMKNNYNEATSRANYLHNENKELNDQVRKLKRRLSKKWWHF